MLQSSSARAAMLSLLVPTAAAQRDMVLSVLTLASPLFTLPDKQVKRSGVRPTCALNEPKSALLLKKRVSGSVALTGSVALLRGSLLPSIKRTSAMSFPAVERRSRSFAGMAMMSKRCLDFS